MKSLIMSLLKLIPLKAAIELILKYLTEQAKKSPELWDDKVMEYAWMLYGLLGSQIPEHIKSKYAKLGVSYKDIA